MKKTLIASLLTVGILGAATVASADEYTVKSGDTLSEISMNLNVGLNELLAMNPHFQGNPDLIFVGEKVTFGNVTATPVEETQTAEAPVVEEQPAAEPVQETQQVAETPAVEAPVQETAPATSGIDLNQTSGSVDINAVANYMVTNTANRPGYSASEWAYIISAESGGSMTVANPSSGAYGVFQLLGHGEYYGMTLGEQINMAANLPAGSWVVYG